MIVLGVGGALIVIGAIVGVVIAAGGGGGGSDQAAVGGPCVVKTYPDQGRQHVTKLPKGFKYNSFPPTSGPHYPPGNLAPAVWNFYDSPVPLTMSTHNLEHGGIVIQYGDVGEETVKDIQSFYQDDPYGLVVAPYPRLGKKIAVTAWNEPGYARNQSEPGEVDAGNGYVMTCTQWDADAAAKFRDERRNKAGERYPSVQDMAPGS